MYFILTYFRQTNFILRIIAILTFSIRTFVRNPSRGGKVLLKLIQEACHSFFGQTKSLQEFFIIALLKEVHSLAGDTPPMPMTPGLEDQSNVVKFKNVFNIFEVFHAVEQLLYQYFEVKKSQLIQ